MTEEPSSRATESIGVAEVRRLVGDVDDATAAAILALHPTLADLEDASICLAGDQDVLAKSGHHVPLTASRILEMLEQQRPRRER